MAKKKSKESAEKQTASEKVASERDVVRYAGLIGTCQRVIKLFTMVIMAGIVLIILMTTVSTGSFVQVTAKGLYYLVLLSAFISLVAWVMRIRFEKQIGQGVHVPAEILKRL